MAGMTDVGIANLALAELGQPVISAFTDDGKAARILRVMYEPTVLEVLRGHPWRCARKKVILAEDTSATPPFGFSNACPLPGDFVKIIRVNDNIDKFERVGSYLHVDDTAPELTYTARIGEDKFDPLLTSTVVARLTWRLCIALTDNATAAQNYQNTYTAVSAEAKFADALDGSPEDQPIGTWAQARLSEV